MIEITDSDPAVEALLLSLRSLGHLAGTPILCVTAGATAESRARLLRTGATDCLSAPFLAEELEARVAGVLASGRARAAQERLHALFQQSPDGVFLATPEGRIVEVNEAGCQVLGYPRDEILGKTALDFAATMDEVQTMRSTLKVLQQREAGVQLIERVLRRKDGSRVLVEVYSQLLPDGSRQSFVRDISARRQVEAELRRSEARAASILATSVDAIVSINVEGRITGWNQGAEQIFGYSRGEALGASLDLIVPERLRAQHAAHVKQFAAGPESARLAGNRPAPIIGLRKSGQEFPADASISKARVDGETILTVTLRDITEQRRGDIEQQLLAEAGAALLAHGFEEAQDKVVRAACESFADFAALFLQEADGPLRITTVASPSLGAADAERLLRRPLAPTPDCAVWRAFTTRASFAMELTPPQPEAEAGNEELMHAVRAARLRSVVAVPLCCGDDCFGVLSLGAAARDYDARDVQIAEELGRRCALSIKNARLHQAERRAIQARDEVLGIVAHDLRNPLNAISLHLNLLLKRRTDPDGRWLQPAEGIRNAALRMDHIIQDLLDVARLESGVLSMQIEQLQVSEVLADAVEAQRSLAASSSIELRLDAPQELPPIWADCHRLLQVLQNLLSNAIKFSSPGGQVAVGADAQEGAVRFRVSDTGIGIPSSSIPHLFERFWQAEQTDRRGIGLGLFIAKGIVAAHGGSIWVESTPGRGSTFFFTIPTTQPIKAA
ncbi:MAG: PAS domain S-box protein [Polyangia bacterium]